MISKFRLLSLVLLLVFGVLTSGCISIEQEIFLQPDGSGDLLLHISLPDFPEELKKGGPMGGESPEDTLQKFKREVAGKLPPTVKLKEAKEVKRNGTQGFYAIFNFKSLKDVQNLMTEVMKETAKDAQTGDRKPTEWQIQSEKQGALTVITQRFFADLSESKVSAEAGAKVEVKSDTPGVMPEAQTEAAISVEPARRRQTTKGRRVAPRRASAKTRSQTGQAEAKATMDMADFSKQLEPLIYSAVKFRFVLHTPSPISNSNADIVVNGRTALWDCSLAAFAKEKKPIEMKVSF